MHDIVGQADATSVRAHGNAHLGRHEQDCENLVDAGKAARVDLANVDGFGSEELLEAHPVVCVLARSWWRFTPVSRHFPLDTDCE